MYRVGNGHVLVDFGHNPHAFAAVTELARRWHGSRVTGVVSVPGDRADWLIAEAGRVAARGFDRVIVRSDHDLRGRRPGEVAEILCAAIRETSPEIECHTIQDECEALRQVLGEMQDGELIVFFYEHDLPPILEILHDYGAVPAVDEIPIPLVPEVSTNGHGTADGAARRVTAEVARSRR